MKRLIPWLIIVLLAGVFAWICWRRFATHPAPAATVPAPAAKPAEFVDLAGPNERKTIDYSSGRPVVKDTAADQAAVDAAVKDMDAAARSVTFEAPKKKTEPKK
jgi:hypothetical protein